MRKHPRRTLLGGIGSTMAIATAGCLSLVDDESIDDDAPEPGDGIDALLEFVPATLDDSVALSTADIDRLATADTPNGHGAAYGLGAAVLQQWNGDIAAVSNGVAVERLEEFELPLVILELEDEDVESDDLEDGDLEADVTFDSHEHDSGVAYERGSADDEDGVVALVDNVVIAGDSETIVDDALDAGLGDATSLLEDRPAIDAGLEYFGTADSTGVTTNDEGVPEFDLDPDDLEYLAYATTVRDPQTIEYRYGLALESESLITDDLLETFEAEFGDGFAHGGGDVSVDVDGAVMTATWTLDLEAQQRAMDHDSPSGLRVEDIDPESEYVEISVTHGDPTPVEELTIEIDDEPYDEAIWADGQSEIGDGDTIRFEAELLEPNLPVTITHETDHFSSSVTTTVFGHFQFEFDHDLDGETLTVRYEDEYALDGSDVTLAVHESDAQFGDEPAPVQTATPWDDTTLSAGDEATLEGVEPGQIVVVGWRGTAFDDSIATTTVRPPGMAHIDYEYETNTLSAELVFDDGRTEPADEYELLVDDEPTPTQWSDTADTVSDGSTVVLEDVEVGTQVTVTWGDGVRVGGGSATPSIAFTATLEDGDLVLTHDDGPALPVSELRADIFPTTEHDTVEFETVADGKLSEGDSVTVLEDVDTDPDSISVSVQYGDHWIGSAHPAE